MSGMLTVVGNPRGKRRRNARRRRRARSHHKTTRRRRVARASNPAPRRRRRRVAVARRRRHSNPARRRRHVRRHRNPILGGGITRPLMAGLGIGAGIYAAEVGAAAVNGYLLKDKPLTGLAKTGLKAAIALIGLPMLLKVIPGGRKFVGPVMLGGGAMVALDLLHQFATPMLPGQVHDGDTLKGYEYGTLSAYRSGTLSNWAPQAGVSGWAPQAGVSGSDDGVFGGGAFD